MVGFFLFLSLIFPSWAVVSVEGIIKGQGDIKLQTDPLSQIFKDLYDKSNVRENKKLTIYRSTYQSGQELDMSCSEFLPSKYSTNWQETQAIRSVVAGLQYLGLDRTIKAIGAYARLLNVSREDFSRLKLNLITNYCSKNLTVMSLKSIDKTLDHYYEVPDEGIIPQIKDSPFATSIVKINSEKNSTRSKEFDHVVKSFRAFCSWGGEVDDLRMLGPYLSNSFIMALYFKNMLGKENVFSDKGLSLNTIQGNSSLQVSCVDLICRNSTREKFKQTFPLSVGSSGLETDLKKIYCHHFKKSGHKKESISQIKDWIKKEELEDPIWETSHFLSLLTGVPDFFNGVGHYAELEKVLKSSIDQRWDSWASSVISQLSSKLLFEEALKIKIHTRADIFKLASDGFGIDASISVGEMDRIVDHQQNLSLRFELKISKNYLRSLRSKSAYFQNNVDLEGMNNFKQEVGDYLAIQFKEKEKLFLQTKWNKDFIDLVTNELIAQVRTYEGPLFENFQDEVLRIPVQFSYGLFALSYLNYRAQTSNFPSEISE